MSKVEIEVQVSRLGTKHRWEKMCQGDDIEKLDDDEIAEALKELEKEKERDKLEKKVMANNDLNLVNTRPTELKFNTRVIPPVMATSNSEAAITNQEEV